MKSVNRIIKMMLVILFLLLNFNSVFAGYESELTKLTKDIEIGNGQITQFQDPTNKILGIVQVLGIVASVIALMLIGIKYMTASVEGKAEYKKTMWLYIVGALLTFGICAILKTLYGFVSGISI